jgi:hypothetical protein
MFCSPRLAGPGAEAACSRFVVHQERSVAKDRDLEARIDELYRAPPEEFVSARDALARELKEAGDGDAAASVKGLRRPAVAMWALNRLALEQPEEIETLLAAGAELRQAQERLLMRGGAADLRGASSRRRAEVARLSELALALLEEAGRGRDAHRNAVAGTLEAATADEDVADLLRRGRLEKEHAAVGGFGDLAGFASVSPVESDERRPKTRDRTGQRAAGPEPDERAEAADREAREAEDAAEAAEEEARAARADAEAASARAKELGAEADRLEEEARDARRRAKEAATEARDAGSRASKAASAAARASRRAAEARAAATGSTRKRTR